MEQQFSLSWNNFHGNITKGFSSLLANSEFVDVTLAVDGQLLQAHKIVLAICSPYFKRMFKSNPCQHPIVVLRGVSTKAMKDLLHFMYHGEVSVRQEDLTSFISTAEILQIKGLTNKTTEDETPEVERQSPCNDDTVQETGQTAKSPVEAFCDVSVLSERNSFAEHRQRLINRLAALKRKSDDVTNTPNFYNNNVALDDYSHSSDKRCRLKEKTQTVGHNIILNPRSKTFDFDSTNNTHRYDEPTVNPMTMSSLDPNNMHLHTEDRSSSTIDHVKSEGEEPVYNLMQRRYSDSILSNSQDSVRVNGASDENPQHNLDPNGQQEGILSLVTGNRCNAQPQLPHRYKYIFSRKGHKQLVHMNFVYTKHSTSHGKTSWRCVQYFSLYKCPATIETVGPMIFALNHQHNHEDCHDKIMKNEVYEMVCSKD